MIELSRKTRFSITLHFNFFFYRFLQSPNIESYAMYNDQPPVGNAPVKFAHSKGLLITEVKHIKQISFCIDYRRYQ